MNKKGGLTDPLYVIIFLVAFALTTIFSLFILNEFEDQTAGQLTSSTSIKAIDDGQATILGLDNLFIFILIGLITATIVGAFMVEANPIVFWASLLLLLIFLVVTAILSNAYSEVVQDPVLASTTANFPLMDWVITNLGMVMTITFILVTIAMFAKWRSLG